MNEKYATRGQGKAIHITTEVAGALVTLCDRWATANALGGRQKGRVRPIYAAAATCKSCQRAAEKGE